jgi:hypothetical protein
MHLSRLNVVFGDGGSVEEIVEEELPLVSCSGTLLTPYRTHTRF